MRLAISIFAAVLLPLMSAVAEAHTGHGIAAGFATGFMHPATGLDHILAMIAAGFLAARIGGRALWLIPVAFLSMMNLGGALGMAGVGLPLVETMIALSVVALGLGIASGRAAPVALAAGLAGAFAFFHGHAHGAEMPADASGLVYGLGFLAATALLHLAGLGLGVASTRSPEAANRLGGGALAAAGLGLLAGVI